MLNFAVNADETESVGDFYLIFPKIIIKVFDAPSDASS